MKSGWKCERCMNCGGVRHDVHAGIYEVLNLIEAAHATESQSLCRFDLSSVRVWKIPEAGTQGER